MFPRTVVRYQPNRDYTSNDDIQTPPALARALVRHFKPRGRVLEPCRGDGNFLRALRAQVIRQVYSCEIKAGRNVFAWDQKVDGILTNPPWSQIRPFLQHAMTVADHVVFVMTINHVWTKARNRDVHSAGFGLREILLLDLPPEFPTSGFQLGAVHLERDWHGAITLTDWTKAGMRKRR